MSDQIYVEYGGYDYRKMTLRMKSEVANMTGKESWNVVFVKPLPPGITSNYSPDDPGPFGFCVSRREILNILGKKYFEKKNCDCERCESIKYFLKLSRDGMYLVHLASVYKGEE